MDDQGAIGVSRSITKVLDTYGEPGALSSPDPEDGGPQVVEALAKDLGSRVELVQQGRAMVARLRREADEMEGVIRNLLPQPPGAEATTP